ncbi:hypothetical protein, partial [Halocynthiibacter sp.]|uniref:hypothetical protein n=1 Tax=Halocynthiibacter sp. TaxID=1979210 RepID=UPI003C3235C4
TTREKSVKIYKSDPNIKNRKPPIPMAPRPVMPISDRIEEVANQPTEPLRLEDPVLPERIALPLDDAAAEMGDATRLWNDILDDGRPENLDQLLEALQKLMTGIDRSEAFGITPQKSGEGLR